MSQLQKLLKKLLSNSKTFTFEDAESLLSYYGFYRDNMGKTSGSRVRFVSDVYHTQIILHIPHPHKELHPYQIKSIIEILKKEGLI